MMIRLPWYTQVPFALIATGAVCFILGIFIPQFPALYLPAAVLLATGLLVQFLTWDARATALRVQVLAAHALQVSPTEASALLANQVVSLADGRDVRLRFHGLRTLELVSATSGS